MLCNPTSVIGLRLQEKVLVLICGHVFHQECIHTYASVKQVNLEDLQCPTCKVSANDQVVVDDTQQDSVAAAGPEPEAAAASDVTADVGDGVAVTGTAADGDSIRDGDVQPDSEPESEDVVVMAPPPWAAPAAPGGDATASELAPNAKTKAKTKPKAKSSAAPAAPADEAAAHVQEVIHTTKAKAKAKTKAKSAAAPTAPKAKTTAKAKAAAKSTAASAALDGDEPADVPEVAPNAKAKAKAKAAAKSAAASAALDGDAPADVPEVAPKAKAKAKAKTQARAATAPAASSGDAPTDAAPKAKATAKATAKTRAESVAGGGEVQATAKAEMYCSAAADAEMDDETLALALTEASEPFIMHDSDVAQLAFGSVMCSCCGRRDTEPRNEGNRQAIAMSPSLGDVWLLAMLLAIFTAKHASNVGFTSRVAWRLCWFWFLVRLSSQPAVCCPNRSRRGDVRSVGLRSHSCGGL